MRRVLSSLRRVLPQSLGSENSSFLLKWAFLSTIIGLVAGLGAALFYFALEEATKLLHTGIGGHVPPMPLGEGGTPAAVVPVRTGT